MPIPAQPGTATPAAGLARTWEAPTPAPPTSSAASGVRSRTTWFRVDYPPVSLA
jgi:hypothetical protein